MVINKSRLIDKGYNQQKCIDFSKTFAHNFCKCFPLQIIFEVNAGLVWDEYDGRDKVITWYSNKSIQRWSLYSSDKIHKGASEEVQARWLQDHDNSYASNL